MSSKPIYLDHAAATPLDTKVLEVMKPYLESKFYNPSSLYGASQKVRQAVEEARWQVAQLLGAKKTEIIFVAGGTESINLAIFGVLRYLSATPQKVIRHQKAPATPGRGSTALKLVTTSIEHEAVLSCIPALEKEGHQVSIVPVKTDGIIDVDKLIAAVDNQTVLMSVMYANNEIGTIQPIREISRQIESIRQDRLRRGIKLPLLFHTDACQAGGLLDLKVSRLGVDLMTLNGSKIYGPKQIGCLYIRTGTPLEPLIYGGGQERGLRSGTENVAAIVGFAKALELAQQSRETESARLAELRNVLLTELTRDIPDLKLNGHANKRLASNLNIIIPGINGETAVLYLDREGVQASTGSACSTGNTDPSHVLLSIGCTRAEASASLRFSLGHVTTRADVDYLARKLPVIVNRLRQLAHEA